MYKIIDNFLPTQEFEHIKKTLMSPHFEWYYNGYSISKEHDDIPQFIHNFIRINGTQAGIPSSQHIDELTPIFDRIDNLCTILRCKANLTLQHTENIETGLHVDTASPFNGFTSVLYLNDTNGGTKFENGDIVECKANRFVTFDNRIKHTGILCTDQKRRVIINFNYTVWESK